MAITTPVAATDPYAAVSSASKAVATGNDAGSADRFLKLLVTQMQNQDPLNPMDNAQITSQMAQINTVNGIQTLNSSVQGLNAQFLQLQVLSGASLVGREVTLAGNKLALAGGKAVAGFELGSAAERVRVEVLNPAGRVVDTLELGAQGAGTHGFDWLPANTPDSAPDAPYTFRVVATSGTTTLAPTLLMRDRIEAVQTGAQGLTLQTGLSGAVGYGDIRAFN